MTTPISLDPDRALRAMRKIKELQAQIDEWNEAIDNLKDVVIANLPTGETILGDNENGHLKAVVYRSKQFNEAWGKANAPEIWEKAADTRKVVDSATAKRKLTAQEYEAFQKPSAKMSVKVEVLNG